MGFSFLVLCAPCRSLRISLPRPTLPRSKMHRRSIKQGRRGRSPEGFNRWVLINPSSRVSSPRDTRSPHLSKERSSHFSIKAWMSSLWLEPDQEKQHLSLSPCFNASNLTLQGWE